MNEQEIRDAIEIKEQVIESAEEAVRLLEEEKRQLQEELEFALYGLKPGMRVIDQMGMEYELIRFERYHWIARKIKKNGEPYAVNTSVWGDSVTIKKTE